MCCTKKAYLQVISIFGLTCSVDYLEFHCSSCLLATQKVCVVVRFSLREAAGNRISESRQGIKWSPLHVSSSLLSPSSLPSPSSSSSLPQSSSAASSLPPISSTSSFPSSASSLPPSSSSAASSPHLPLSYSSSTNSPLSVFLLRLFLWWIRHAMDCCQDCRQGFPNCIN